MPSAAKSLTVCEQSARATFERIVADARATAEHLQSAGDVDAAAREALARAAFDVLVAGMRYVPFQTDALRELVRAIVRIDDAVPGAPPTRSFAQAAASVRALTDRLTKAAEENQLWSDACRPPVRSIVDPNRRVHEPAELAADALQYEKAFALGAACGNAFNLLCLQRRGIPMPPGLRGHPKPPSEDCQGDVDTAYRACKVNIGPEIDDFSARARPLGRVIDVLTRIHREDGILSRREGLHVLTEGRAVWGLLTTPPFEQLHAGAEARRAAQRLATIGDSKDRHDALAALQRALEDLRSTCFNLQEMSVRMNCDSSRPANLL